MTTRSIKPPAFRQRGRFLTGLIVGLLIGVALSLGVALYVTKVPVPFLDKVPQRTAEQDAAERERSKNWDPNGPAGRQEPGEAGAGSAAPSAASGAERPASSSRDPAAILADRPANASAAASTVSTRPMDEAFSYYVQTGAYSSAADAESQRGQLGLQGFSAKVTEREQSGRPMHRVRLGPFDDRGEADAVKEKLTAAGFEAVLVRAPR